MSNRSAFVAAACTLALGFASIAGAQDAPAPAPGTAAASDVAPVAPKAPEKVLKLQCTLEKATGTQMLKRVCRTEAQVDADREAARRAMDQAMSCTRAGC